MNTLIGIYADFKDQSANWSAELTPLVHQMKRVMPEAKLVQMCNSKQAVEYSFGGVDEVWEMDDTGDFNLNRILHHKTALEKFDRYLAMDIDIWVNFNLLKWFDQHDFTFSCTYNPAMTDFELRPHFGMFYNHGVLFCKNDTKSCMSALEAMELWLDRMEDTKGKPFEWLAGQRTFGELVEPWENNPIRFLQLPVCYNYAPVTDQENTEGVFAVHYKGDKRKKKLLAKLHAMRQRGLDKVDSIAEVLKNKG